MHRRRHHIREDQQRRRRRRRSSSFLSNFLLLEHKVYEAYESERDHSSSKIFLCAKRKCTQLCSISMMAEDWKTNFMNDKRKRAKEKNSLHSHFLAFFRQDLAGAPFSQENSILPALSIVLRNQIKWVLISHVHSSNLVS